MLYKYEATSLNGERQTGTIEASTLEIAISSLQRRNLIIIFIEPAEKIHFWQKEAAFFKRIKARDIVIFSRQLATLFEAGVPTLESFKLLAAESENPLLRKKLSQVVEDIQGGISMSQAMSKHPDIFSRFYVSMVRSGEESGKLSEIFIFLADNLERNYEITTKARNALIYPAFIMLVFIAVTVLMMMFVFPRLGELLKETHQELPLFTRIILGLSDFIRTFAPFILIALVIGIILLWRYSKTETGKMAVAHFKITVPFIGLLYKKIYMARLADNLKTLLASGIPMIRSIEITADVVGNEIYKKILLETKDAVKGGSSLSDTLLKYEDIPPLISRMVKIGEETGKLSFTLETIARFYRREVYNIVDNLVSLIEPFMIVFLGAAVGILMVSILGPIYSMISSL